MIYTVSSNPQHLPKNVWLCEAYIPLGETPRFTAYSPATKKWGDGHIQQDKVKFTLDAPGFSVYTNEEYNHHWANDDEYYLDLDSKVIYKGLTQIPWAVFLNYLFSFGILVSFTQLNDYFSKPFVLADKVHLWNAKIKISTPAELSSTTMANNHFSSLDSFLAGTAGAAVSEEEQAQVSAQAVESIYEEMKKQAFTFKSPPLVKKPYINPYKWVLSGGKVTYTPTEQVATDGKPEF